MQRLPTLIVAYDELAPRLRAIAAAAASEPLNLRQTLTLNGAVMQDSNTGNMTHDIYDMLSYVSHIATMQPGDIYAMGSPSGVGTARETPIYIKPGDVAVCAIEGIGTLTNPVVGPDAE